MCEYKGTNLPAKVNVEEKNSSGREQGDWEPGTGKTAGGHGPENGLRISNVSGAWKIQRSLQFGKELTLHCIGIEYTQGNFCRICIYVQSVSSFCDQRGMEA